MNKSNTKVSTHYRIVWLYSINICYNIFVSYELLSEYVWLESYQNRLHLFFINNQKFKQSPRKSLICETISKQFAGANKRPKLNNPLQEQAKTLFLHRKPIRNAHFWTCHFKSVHPSSPCNKLWQRSECLNI